MSPMPWIIDSGMRMRSPWISKFSPDSFTSGRSTIPRTCFQNLSPTSFFEALRRTAVHHWSGKWCFRYAHA